MARQIDIVVIVCIVFVILIITVSVLSMRARTKIDDAFRRGDITLEQYCDEITLGGTTTKLPVACYGQFNLKAVGTHEECRHNGRRVTCVTYPTLESNSTN